MPGVFEHWFDAKVARKNATTNAQPLSFVEKLRDVPTVHEKRVLCVMTPRQQLLYDAQALPHDDYKSNLRCMYELQQICNHPNLYEKGTSDKEALFGCDPVSQMDFVCCASGQLKIRRPRDAESKSDSAAQQRLEAQYKPWFDKVRDTVHKISREQKAKEMKQDEVDDDDSRRTAKAAAMSRPTTIRCTWAPWMCRPRPCAARCRCRCARSWPRATRSRRTPTTTKWTWTRIMLHKTATVAARTRRRMC